MGFTFSMGFKDSLERILTKFGREYSPTVVAMGIAAAKGIFRPIFTMMDKTETQETKRYTALREGLTEVIAIPIYYFSGVVSKKITDKLAVPKNFMSKDIYQRHLKGDKSIEVKNAIKHAEDLARINKSKIASTTAFIGVCISALLVIPFTCSATIKPVMKFLEKRNSKKKYGTDNIQEIKQINGTETKVNTFKGLYSPCTKSCTRKILRVDTMSSREDCQK